MWGRPDNAPKHPYVAFEGTPVWRALKKAMEDLDENQDLELTEWHQYVVGYACKVLARRGVVAPKALKKSPKRKALPSGARK